MLIEQVVYRDSGLKEVLVEAGLKLKAQWVLVFGTDHMLSSRVIFDDLRVSYPNAYIMGCTTAGEIYATLVDVNTVVATAICFQRTEVRFASVDLEEYDDIFSASEALARMLPPEDLKHVFLLSEGLNINGSDLVLGLRNNLPPGVNATGGLSGDGGRFKETTVIANQPARKNLVVMAGFYGEAIRIGNGSYGGWSPFGIERLVTKSDKNVLYELDGRSALDLYKEYLGEEHSKQLPLSALHFPLSIRSKDGGQNLVRTILAVNEANKSLTFAGDIPEGYYAKLMKANSSGLIQGARTAALNSLESLDSGAPKFAILISCVGRILVLKQLVDEEIEETRETLGQSVVFTGFYSYGEISSIDMNTPYALHNQTMTITLFDEVLE